jgi:hypothetical protein
MRKLILVLATLMMIPNAFAGRSMELEHWRAIETVKEARVEKARADTELHNAEGAKGRRGENKVYPSPRPPFKYTH